NLALEATTDTQSEEVEVENPPIPAVERPEYETPRAILQRPRTTLIQCREVEASQDQDIPDCSLSDEASSKTVTVKEALEDLDQVTLDIWATDPLVEKTTDMEVDRERPGEEDGRGDIEDVSLDQTHAIGQDQGTTPSESGGADLPSMMSIQPGTGHVTGDLLNDKCTTFMSQKTDMDPPPVVEDQPDTSDLDFTWDSDQDYDECVYYHERSDLYAEDVDGQMAVLPEGPVTTGDVKIGDIQLQTPEEIERLCQKIWKFRHLLIGKGNALPPAARGVVCDIDVGGARPIALKCRKLRIQFREKLADLIKGLLSARMVNYSRSPWASPIVVSIKKNGVDIRLCIDYRLVNSLTQLMVYPMPLINDLLEDLESTLWYCSLDMTSGFWVVKMTDRARLISAFVTPFGQFEWNRMPFGLKNAPQIYQRRRSYIDDILIPAISGDQLCDRVEGLLEACDKWNLSISIVKSFWGMPKVEYLGHKVSRNGLEGNPKDLSSLTDLVFPGSLRAMQSFLGSLNYYSRFIEDYAIYASVLYELREIDFAAMAKEATRGQQVLEAGGADPGSQEDLNVDHRRTLDQEAPDPTETRVATTPILRHFDPDRKATVVVYASDWAISGALMQEYDQIYYPVTFASRTLKSNELNYGIAGSVSPSEDPRSQLQCVGRASNPCANPTLNIGVALQINSLTRTFRTMGGPAVALDS
ncbi:reverse transcriptase, partial [Phytophthora megakarya]